MMEYTKDMIEVEHDLKKYNQLHLLDFCMTLEGNERKQFIEDIKCIDFELIKNLYDKTEGKNEHKEDKITPIEYVDKYKLNEEYKYFEDIGKRTIREGKLAAVTMAGGQGTRLRT